MSELCHFRVTSLFTPLDVVPAYAQYFVGQIVNYEGWDQFVVTWRRIFKKKTASKSVQTTLEPKNNISAVSCSSFVLPCGDFAAFPKQWLWLHISS